MLYERQRILSFIRPAILSIRRKQKSIHYTTHSFRFYKLLFSSNYFSAAIKRYYSPYKTSLIYCVRNANLLIVEMR